MICRVNGLRRLTSSMSVIVGRVPGIGLKRLSLLAQHYGPALSPSFIGGLWQGSGRTGFRVNACSSFPVSSLPCLYFFGGVL